MSQVTISDQHNQWHNIYGRYVTCPLDCGAGEVVSAVFENDHEALLESGARGIRCGACKGRHFSASTVKLCHEVKLDAGRYERTMAAFEEILDAAGDCDHSLSAALCEGPNHYPADR